MYYTISKNIELFIFDSLEYLDRTNFLKLKLSYDDVIVNLYCSDWDRTIKDGFDEEIIIETIVNLNCSDWDITIKDGYDIKIKDVEMNFTQNIPLNVIYNTI